jgi:WD40 repeat protein
MALLRFSPDGKLLAVVAEGTIYSWDAATWQLAATQPGSGSQAAAAYALSPDGALLAVADGDDNAATVYGVATGSVAGRFNDPDSNPDDPGMASVAFSPDGKVLAAADQNGNISLWDAG